jgi:hypothetical protein
MKFACVLLRCAPAVMILRSGVAWAQTSYVTDFNVTESPVSESGAWRHAGLEWTRIAVANGLAFGTQTGNGGFDDSYAYLAGFSADQSASGVVHLDSEINSSTTHEVEILLRWADSAHTVRGYECNFAYNGQYADIVRWNGPKDDFTYLVPTLTANIPGGLHEGDIVSAKIVGHVITTYVNGTQILSVSDDRFNDGNPGMGFWRGAPSGPMNDFAFTRFTATSLTVPSVPVPATNGWRWRTLSCLALVGVAYTLLRRTQRRPVPDVK